MSITTLATDGTFKCTRISLTSRDVNIDGRVDVVDLLLARRALLGEYEFGDIPRLHADVAPLADGVPRPDGEFNLGDVLVIQLMALGL